jgi:aryl-alcohol dehydrogenase-like predicted oxidoreductase
MRQRAIADATVTAVALGDVRFATAAARNVHDLERALHEALTLGITLVDCSDEEPAERLCGDALRSLRLRDRVVLATRVPLARLHVREVQPRIEAALRSTRLDALPLAMIPIRAEWLDSPVWPELAGTCARLVREGKVQRWGAEVTSADDVMRVAPPAPAPAALGDLFAGLVPAPASTTPTLDPRVAELVVAIAMPLSLCDRHALPLLAGPVPVLARAPLAGGALAGTLGPGVKLAINDDRRALDEPALERIAVACAKLSRFVRDEPPAARSCEAARAVVERTPRLSNLEAITIAELALRWVIDRGAIAMPRLHRPEHLGEVVAAAAAPPLSPELVARLDELFASP